MKGGVVSNVLTVLALQTAGIRLAGDLIVDCVVDEEAGGNGTLGDCPARAQCTDACIFTEPTGLDRISRYQIAARNSSVSQCRAKKAASSTSMS